MSNNKQTLIEQFFRECGKYTDTAQIPNKVILKFMKMEKDKIEQAELDAKEIVIIKECATQSTSDASKYAEGYSEGYKRALELIEWYIEQMKAKEKRWAN
jgi:predicted acylesterase/phospholipase RssA